MAKTKDQNSLTPLYLAHLLGLERNLQSATTEETMGFVDALMAEEQLCTLSELLFSFGFRGKPVVKLYQKFVDAWKPAIQKPEAEESSEQKPKETKMKKKFLQESKALYILTVLPDDLLRQRWEEKQVALSLQEKDPSSTLLKVMSLSPLRKDLQLCHQLFKEFETSVINESSSIRGLEHEGASLADSSTFLLDEDTSEGQLPPSHFALIDSPQPAANPHSILPSELFDPISAVEEPSPKTGGLKVEAAPLPTLEVSITVEELTSWGEVPSFGVDTTHEDHEEDEEDEDENEDEEDEEDTVVVDTSKDTTRLLSPMAAPTTPIESLPSLARNCIQIIMENQLDPEFLADTLRFLRSRATSKSRLSSIAFSPEIKICSWNTLKLAILSRPAFVQDPVFLELSTHDIICLQEVPFTSKGTTEDSSIEKLRAKISHRTSFKVITSTPSGYGASAKKEVHGILYAEKTWELLGHRTLDSSHFDYAPIVAKFKHVDFPGYVFIFASVHFPPEGRARDQAKQISAFEEAYKRCVSEDLKEAYTFQGAKDARKAKPIHVVMGDFNNVPEFRDLKNAWGEKQTTMKTSAGGRPFDHFYLNKDAYGPFEVEPRVLHLQFDKEKPSDHSPITLRLTKQPETSSKKQSVFKTHHEEEEGGEH